MVNVKKRYYFPYILTLFILSSCATTYTKMYSINMYGKDMYFPPTKQQYIQVFMKKPAGDFFEMGEITVKSAYSIENAKFLFKKKAAELGGDAVYIINITPFTRESPYHPCCGYGCGNCYLGYSFNNYETRFNVTGIIIKYNKQ